MCLRVSASGSLSPGGLERDEAPLQREQQPVEVVGPWAAAEYGQDAKEGHPVHGAFDGGGTVGWAGDPHVKLTSKNSAPSEKSFGSEIIIWSFGSEIIIWSFGSEIIIWSFGSEISNRYTPQRHTKINLEKLQRETVVRTRYRGYRHTKMYIS